MSRIRGKNTKPELLVRRGLHSRGVRYRLHDRSLPGRPDLVFPRFHTVAFIHGCFWHNHCCTLSKMPATNAEFWRDKLAANAVRDRKAIDELQAAGWRVLVIWECSLRGRRRQDFVLLIEQCCLFIRSSRGLVCEISEKDMPVVALSGMPHSALRWMR
jgi:DNA mismatch endonuclease (patch repair protein)